MSSYSKKRNYSGSVPSHSSICISLRQCAILFSILMFVFAAIFTTCTTLGFSHAEETLNILKNDIHYEHEKHEEVYGDHFKLNTNEVLLIHSQHAAITNKSILQILMHFGWILLLASACLIYGTATKSPKLMMPWIILSALSCLAFIMSEILLYFDYIEGLNFINSKKYIIHVLVTSAAFFVMWYVIVWYNTTLRNRICTQYSSKPKVYYAYGGFIHTVHTNSIQSDKKLIV